MSISCTLSDVTVCPLTDHAISLSIANTRVISFPLISLITLPDTLLVPFMSITMLSPVCASAITSRIASQPCFFPSSFSINGGSTSSGVSLGSSLGSSLGVSLGSSSTAFSSTITSIVFSPPNGIIVAFNSVAPLVFATRFPSSSINAILSSPVVNTISPSTKNSFGEYSLESANVSPSLIMIVSNVSSSLITILYGNFNPISSNCASVRDSAFAFCTSIYAFVKPYVNSSSGIEIGILTLSDIPGAKLPTNAVIKLSYSFPV